MDKLEQQKSTFKILVNNTETYSEFINWYTTLPVKYKLLVSILVKEIEKRDSIIEHSIESFSINVHHVIEIKRCSDDITYFIAKYHKPTFNGNNKHNFSH